MTGAAAPEAPRPLWLRLLLGLVRMMTILFVLIVWDGVLASTADHAGSRIVCSGLDELIEPNLADTRFGAAGRCLAHNGPFAWREFRRIYNDVVPSDPGACKFVGRWYAWREGAVRIIDLREDQRFLAYPLKLPEELMASGRWSYEEGHIRWDYDGMKVDPPDVNEVIDEVSDGFTLIEVNGQHTVFRPTSEHQELACGWGTGKRR